MDKIRMPWVEVIGWSICVLVQVVIMIFAFHGVGPMADRILGILGK